MKRIVTCFLMAVYTFLFIYAPRLIAVNTIHILFVIALPWLIIDKKKFLKVGRNSGLFNFLLILVILNLYKGIVDTLYGGDLIMDIYSILVIGIELPVVVSFQIYLYKKHGFSGKDLVNLIILLGIVQALIAVLMVVSPAFKEIIDNHRFQFWDDRYIGWSSKRMYGFSDNLLHVTPIVQAVISVMLIIKTPEKPYLMIFLPCMLVSIVLNARVGIFIFIISLFFVIFGSYFPGKRKVVALLFIFLFISIFSFLHYFQDYISLDSFENIISGFYDFNDLSRGEKTGVFESLFGEHMVLPQGIDFIFGRGTEVFGGLKIYGMSIHSDIGYVNDLWKYGVFGLVLIVVSYIHLIKKLIKINMKGADIIRNTFLVSFVIGHFKGTLTIYNDYTAIVLLLTGLVIYDYKLNKLSCKPVV